MPRSPFLICTFFCAAAMSVRAATPVHEFDASSPENVLSGNTLVAWTDIGPGHAYTAGLVNIDLNFASSIFRTANFSSPGTNLLGSFQSTGANNFGATPNGQPQSGSIGNGLTDGSVEIWFRTDLTDTDRPSSQVLWESGAATNGFTISLHANGIFDAELRILKAFSNVKIVDLVVPLPNFESSEFIQAVVTFDGDSAVDNNDTIKVYARDIAGNSAYGEALGTEFSTLAGADDSCAFSAAGLTNFGAFGSAGGNTGNTVSLSGFKGEIALIRIYSSAITLADIDLSFGAIADLGDDDDDGMTNFWEGLHGFDKTDPSDANLDADMDMLTNVEEFDAGTNPHDPDSDDDTLTDGFEDSIDSNPLNEDSDGDGLLDQNEIAANPYVTSPILPDTDNDGLSDPVELMIGSDPTDTNSVGSNLVITEFMASNGFSLDDDDGDSSDWIEILNPTSNAIDLSGMALTDDAALPQKWLFPVGALLPAGDFLIVFASGKDRTALGQTLHTNFNLSSSGEYLALIDTDGTTPITEFTPTYPAQQSDVSFGFDGLYLPTPTPGNVNTANGVSGFVADTSFSVDRGTFEAPFTVDISTQTPDAMIIYTTDSSTPTLDNGTQVSASVASIPINQTTVLRAAAFKTGLAPTNVDTHTYLFLDDVVTQSDNPADYEYSNWDNLDQARGADYGMDANISGGLHTHEEVKESLASLPVISMATDAALLFDRETGNYANSKKGGQDWEREVSLEFFGFDHGVTTQTNAGLRLAGNASRSVDRRKHNMRVAFRRQYGTGTLEFPLFPGDDVTTFNSIQLRGGNGDSWVNPGTRTRATYLRDQWHRDAQIAMGQHSQSQIFAHLYVNGWYWGVFHIFERIEDNFMAEHFGGEAEDYDVRDHISAFDGTNASWDAAMAIADDAATMADPQNYADLQQYVDYTHLIDYLLIHFYSNSDDWDQNNFRAGRNNVASETYQFFSWDQERTLLNSLAAGNVNGAIALDKDTNNTTRKGMTHLHQRLRANADYRLLFADRVRKWCFNGEALSPSGASALWDTRAAEVRLAMIAESARWGDLHGTPAKTLADWESRVALEKTGWFDIRTPIFVQLLRDRDLYPQTDAPNLSQHGGQVANNFSLSIENPNASGTIHYTLDGTDPREPGAFSYAGPLSLPFSINLSARVLNGTEWSALTSAKFIVGTPADATNLVVSEIHYNPPGADESGEFIELTNISNNTIQLGGITFTAGLTFTAPIELKLTPGQRLVLTPADYAGSLDNSGETITLTDATGAVIESFSYNDNTPWPTAADGNGPSLVRIEPASQLDPDLPTNWRSSSENGGNPGTSDSTTFPGGDFIEYAFPNSPVASAAGITLIRNRTADDVLYSAEISTDLENWTDAGEMLVTSDDQLGVPLPTSNKYFIRFRATLRD